MAGVIPPSSAFAQWQRRSEEGERAQSPGKSFPSQWWPAQHHSPVLIFPAQKAHRVLLKPHFFTQIRYVERLHGLQLPPPRRSLPPPQFPGLS